MSKPANLSNIGMQIDKVRADHKLTLYRTAKNSGMDYSQFYRIMRGKVRPARETLLRICKGLGCNEQEAAEIFKETDYRLPDQKELEEESSKSKVVTAA